MARKKESIRAEYLDMFGINFLMIKARSFDSVREMWGKLIFEDDSGYELPQMIEDAFNVSSATASRYSECDPQSKRSINDIIFMANMNRDGYDSSHIIAHESYHIMNYIFDTIGHRHDNENDELAAYLLGHIAKLISDFLNER